MLWNDLIAENSILNGLFQAECTFSQLPKMIAGLNYSTVANCRKLFTLEN